MFDAPVLDSPDVHADARADQPVEAQQTLPVVCVVGLGYVGLPVAVAFGKERATIGFDIATRKVARLKQFDDLTGEVSREDLQSARFLTITDDAEEIRKADFVIIAVPTPVNDARQPDFSPLEGASKLVGKNL